MNGYAAILMLNIDLSPFLNERKIVYECRRPGFLGE